MKNIIALGGSNSTESINKTLASFAASLVPNATVNTLDLNDYTIPLYGIDYEQAHGIPEDAKKLNSLIANADGLVISLAEHNGAYSAAFKSVFDWMSRINKEVWHQKPMLLMATSPGARGGQSVLTLAKNTFPHLGGNIVADFSLPSFQEHFNNNTITDNTLLTALKEEVAKLTKAMQ